MSRKIVLLAGAALFGIGLNAAASVGEGCLEKCHSQAMRCTASHLPLLVCESLLVQCETNCNGKNPNP